MWTRQAVAVYGSVITFVLLVLIWIPVQHFVADDQKRQMDVLAADPSNMAALLKLGQDKYNLFDAAGAIKDFGRAIELAPKQALAYRKRADAYDLMKQPDLAKKDRQMAEMLEH